MWEHWFLFPQEVGAPEKSLSNHTTHFLFIQSFMLIFIILNFSENASFTTITATLFFQKKLLKFLKKNFQHVFKTRCIRCCFSFSEGRRVHGALVSFHVYSPSFWKYIFLSDTRKLASSLFQVGEDISVSLRLVEGIILFFCMGGCHIWCFR